MFIVKTFFILCGVIGATIVLGSLCVFLWELIIIGIHAGVFAGIFTIGVVCTIIFGIGMLILGDNLFDD